MNLKLFFLLDKICSHWEVSGRQDSPRPGGVSASTERVCPAASAVGVG